MAFKPLWPRIQITLCNKKKICNVIIICESQIQWGVNSKLVWYLNGQNPKVVLIEWFTFQVLGWVINGLNNKLLVSYSGHG